MKNIKKIREGSEVQYGPRPVGEILHKLNANTELCIDLKTILRSDRKAKQNKDYPGVLRRDGREHFTFIEMQPTTTKRNPQLFKGKYITITRWADGSLHPNFRPMPADMSVEHYAFNVYRELYKALKGLVEENW